MLLNKHIGWATIVINIFEFRKYFRLKMGSGIIEALEKVKVRYPGQPAATPLKELIRENKLTDLLTQQYPDITKPGHVQFVPETRGALSW
jgi:hypothetical protein